MQYFALFFFFGGGGGGGGGESLLDICDWTSLPLISFSFKLIFQLAVFNTI